MPIQIPGVPVQIDFDTAKFGLSAEQFNLDPRELLTTVLQPVWANNQKLELLRIAFEVGMPSQQLKPCNGPITC